MGKLSLGNISADFNQADRKSTGLYGYVYDFSVDYNAITNDKIHDIHSVILATRFAYYSERIIKPFYFL